MFVLRMIAGGGFLALGILDGAQALLPAAARSALARWLRTRAGTRTRRLLTTSVLQVVAGALLLTSLMRSSVALGWVFIALLAGLRMVNSDLRSGADSGIERKLVDAAAGRHPRSPDRAREQPVRAAAEGGRCGLG